MIQILLGQLGMPSPLQLFSVAPSILSASRGRGEFRSNIRNEWYLSHSPPIVYEVGSYLPALETLSRSHHLHAPEGEQSSNAALSIWFPKLNLQHSFNSVVTCEYFALRSPGRSHAERHASLLPHIGPLRMENGKRSQCTNLRTFSGVPYLTVSQYLYHFYLWVSSTTGIISA